MCTKISVQYHITFTPGDCLAQRGLLQVTKDVLRIFLADRVYHGI